MSTNTPSQAPSTPISVNMSAPSQVPLKTQGQIFAEALQNAIAQRQRNLRIREEALPREILVQLEETLNQNSIHVREELERLLCAALGKCPIIPTHDPAALARELVEEIKQLLGSQLSALCKDDLDKHRQIWIDEEELRKRYARRSSSASEHDTRCHTDYGLVPKSFADEKSAQQQVEEQWRWLIVLARDVREECKRQKDEKAELKAKEEEEILRQIDALYRELHGDLRVPGKHFRVSKLSDAAVMELRAKTSVGHDQALALKELLFSCAILGAYGLFEGELEAGEPELSANEALAKLVTIAEAILPGAREALLQVAEMGLLFIRSVRIKAEESRRIALRSPSDERSYILDNLALEKKYGA